MKKDIHPTYYLDAKATCACGAQFVVGSTMKEFKVEICSQCHPFYTGQDKIVDTAGRVEKFKARREKAAARSDPKATVAKKVAKARKAKEKMER